MWKLEYYYDNILIGDLYPICDGGFSFGKKRNEAVPIKFSVSLRMLNQWCETLDFDIRRMFTPLRSSVRIINTQGNITGMPTGGWLSSTPAFSFGNMADTNVEFEFMDWLGMTAGAFLIPPYSYNQPFNLVAKNAIESIVERTILAGRAWPLTVGASDTLATVSGSLEAPKTLKDFLLERSDNQTGTGTFDVYADYKGEITLYSEYGVDLSSTTTFSYPDVGGKYGIKEISFGAWYDYISNIFLTGAGNGYASTSGSEGAAIFSTAQNDDTIDNIGYWQSATSESDIILQTTLNQKATSYVRNTDKPFVTPSITIDGDPHKIFSHDQGGDLWLGDKIMVDVSDWVLPLLPLEFPIALRINSFDVKVDGLGHSSVTLGLYDG